MNVSKDKKTLPPDISKMGFEEALSELEKLVRQLEDGKSGLDDSIRAYERGVMLKRHCEAKLREAKARIEKITVSENSDISVFPFEG